MKFKSWLPLIAFAVFFPAGQAAWAQSYVPGYNAFLMSFGTAVAPGTGVVMMQVEAPLSVTASSPYNTYAYWPISGGTNQSSDFPGVTFTDYTLYETQATSSHATNVLQTYLSQGASGVKQVDVYEADYFLGGIYSPVTNGAGWLNVGMNTLPSALPSNHPAVANFSWIYTSNTASSDNDALRRLDYVINNDSLIAVVAVNNGGSTPIPDLFASSYNAIAVGLSTGDGSIGPTPSGIDGPGRSKPDVVAPHPNDATSYATPEVSGEAATMVQIARAKGYLSFSATNNYPAVIKSIIMAGTDKNAVSSWVRTPTQPLDLHYGAGQINYNYAYQILTAGPQTPSLSSTVSSTGWSYQPITASGSTNYFFTVPSGQSYDFSTILTWQRQIAYTGGGNFTPSMGTLNLQLFQSNSNYSTTGALVDQSISSIDNVQDIFQRMLAPGTYDLRVSDLALSASANFALAWQLQPSAVIPVWSGTANTSPNWSLAANWGGGTPTAPGLLTFGALAASATTNVSNNDFAPNTQFGSLTFCSSASNFSLTGNAVNLSGPIANSSSSNQTIGLNLQLVAGGGTVGTGSQTITFSGAISGSGSLFVSGGGRALLSGINTYTGGTTINSGILQLATPQAIPASGTLNVSNSATLAVNAGVAGQFTNATSGSGSIGGLLHGVGGQGAPVSWANGAILGIDTTSASGGSLTYSGSIGNTNNGANALGLTKLGTGTLVLTASNSFSGPLTISAGTLQVGTNDTTATLGTGKVIDNSLLVIDRSGSYSVANSISGSGALNLAGNGRVSLSGTNTFTGSTTVSSGTLSLLGASSFPLGGSLVIGSGVSPGAVFSLDIVNAAPPATAFVSPAQPTAASDLSPVPEPTSISMTLVAIVMAVILWRRQTLIAPFSRAACGRLKYGRELLS